MHCGFRVSADLLAVVVINRSIKVTDLVPGVPVKLVVMYVFMT